MQPTRSLTVFYLLTDSLTVYTCSAFISAYSALLDSLLVINSLNVLAYFIYFISFISFVVFYFSLSFWLHDPFFPLFMFFCFLSDTKVSVEHTNHRKFTFSHVCASISPLCECVCVWMGFMWGATRVPLCKISHLCACMCIHALMLNSDPSYPFSLLSLHKLECSRVLHYSSRRILMMMISIPGFGKVENINFTLFRTWISSYKWCNRKR